MGELLAHPVVPFIVGAALVGSLPRRAGHVVMITAPLIALAQVIALDAGDSVSLGYLGYELEVLRVDRLSIPFGVVFPIAATIAGIYGMATQRSGERSAALAYAGAAMGVVFAGDLLTFFVFWEIKAITSALVIFARGTRPSGRAGMRYLFVHVLGGKLLLAGVVLHYSQTGSLAFETFEPGIASTLILVACLISAAVPPLHAWLTDAYPSASVAGTVFLSAYTTKAAVYALARGFAGFDVLIYLGIIMALYGVVYAVLENDTRRLLGYHIISQVGYMVTAVGIGTELAINGATAHAFAHILYKGLLLMGVGAVLHATGISKMSALGGLANRMRTVVVLYMIGAVSISGFPLFSGFVSKELTIEAAYAEHMMWLVILLKIASVGTFLHTGLKLPYGTWLGREGVGPRTNAGARIKVGPTPATMLVAMGIAAALNVGIGVAPDLLYSIMPYPVEAEPYAFSHVVQTVQVLIFTAFGFWLLLDKLGAKAKVTVDTDWVYRVLPYRIRDAVAARTAARQPRRARGAVPLSELPATVRAAVARPFAVNHGPAPIAALWTLGSVVLATSTVLFLLSLSS